MDNVAIWLTHKWNVLMESIGANSLIAHPYCPGGKPNLEMLVLQGGEQAEVLHQLAPRTIESLDLSKAAIELCESPGVGYVIMIVGVILILGIIKAKLNNDEDNNSFYRY